MSHFGALLKEARRRAKLSQKELAKKIPINNSYISKMENEDFLPSRDVAVSLADALGLRENARLDFLLAAKVASDKDVQEFTDVEVDKSQALGGMPPAITGAGGFGSGVGLGAILRRRQNIGSLIEQTVTEAQLTPEKRLLAERLILENARLVCQILAKEQD